MLLFYRVQWGESESWPARSCSRLVSYKLLAATVSSGRPATHAHRALALLWLPRKTGNAAASPWKGPSVFAESRKPLNAVDENPNRSVLIVLCYKYRPGV